MTNPTKSEKPTVIQTGLTTKALADRITENLAVLQDTLKRSQAKARFLENQQVLPLDDIEYRARVAVEPLPGYVVDLHGWKASDLIELLKMHTPYVWTIPKLRRVAEKLEWVSKVGNQDVVKDHLMMMKIEAKTGNYAHTYTVYREVAVRHLIACADDCWTIATKGAE